MHYSHQEGGFIVKGDIMAAFASSIGGASPIEQAIRNQAPQTMQVSPAAAGYNPTAMGAPSAPSMPLPQSNPVGVPPSATQAPVPQNEESMLILKALTDRLKADSDSKKNQLGQ